MNKKDLVDSSIENPRLWSIWWIVSIYIAAKAGYGFFLKLDLVVLPLIIQVSIDYTATAVLSLDSASWRQRIYRMEGALKSEYFPSSTMILLTS